MLKNSIYVLFYFEVKWDQCIILCNDIIDMRKILSTSEGRKNRNRKAESEREGKWK